MRTVILILASAGFAASCSCGPHKPTREHEPPVVYPIGTEELYRVYRTGKPSATWDNTMVQLRAGPKEYGVQGRSIHLLCTVKDDLGLIVCECSVTLPDNSARIVVTGTCRGPVHDGIKRTSTTRHYVRIEGCSVIVE